MESSFCISNKLPGDTDTAGLGTVPRLESFMYFSYISLRLGKESFRGLKNASGLVADIPSVSGKETLSHIKSADHSARPGGRNRVWECFLERWDPTRSFKASHRAPGWLS